MGDIDGWGPCVIQGEGAIARGGGTEGLRRGEGGDDAAADVGIPTTGRRCLAGPRLARPSFTMTAGGESRLPVWWGAEVAGCRGRNAR
jgi:hypothetical protein